MKRALPILILFLASCGGGGGGGISGAADARINASPRSVDTGDRIKITITINDVHENGIALKVRYPSELSFVESSALIESDGDEFNIVPDVNVAVSNDNYLVFYLREEDLGKNAIGDLIFELLARDSSDDALIEIDPDVDDPLVENHLEFNPDQPLFDAEDQVSVFIKG